MIHLSKYYPAIWALSKTKTTTLVGKQLSENFFWKNESG
jgi:hypothetical protein